MAAHAQRWTVAYGLDEGDGAQCAHSENGLVPSDLSQPRAVSNEGCRLVRSNRRRSAEVNSELLEQQAYNLWRSR
jgi:hypothetical protein